MKDNNIPGLELSVLGNSLLLTGTVSKSDDIDRIERICKAINIPLIDGTRQALADSRMVLFEVSFTEVNRDAFKEFGVKWPTSTGLGDPKGIRIGSLEPTQNLEITINHLIHEGKARIISKPRLTCVSGQEATFQAGGEIGSRFYTVQCRNTLSWNRILGVSGGKRMVDQQ